MNKFEILKAATIEKAMQESKRQYLVGELSLPQALEYIHDKDVEAGITEYQQYTIEKPHYHERTSEYIYVLEGETKYFNLNTREEIRIGKGDFFIIRKHTTYAQKSPAGLKLLFFKYPLGNDKISIEDDGSLTKWYEKY